MRLKHYLLIALTILMIAFFQPFIVFLGNLIVIGCALAYVYSDMTPEAQDKYEQKLASYLQRFRQSLRGRGAARAEARMQKRSGIFRMLRRKKTVSASPPMVIEDAVEAEFELHPSTATQTNGDTSTLASESDNYSKKAS